MNGRKLSALSLVLSLVAGTSSLRCGGRGPDDLNDGSSWEDFLRATYRDPETGVFVVDGDTPIENEKKLLEFYGKFVASGTPLIVHRNGANDARWSDAQKADLTYCVSTTFGARHAQVVAAMEAAGLAWSSAAAVRFRYLPEEDGRCTKENQSVLFDVNPVNAQGSYLARSFFPGQARVTRNVLIDSSSFRPNSWGLDGILRHELGHTLGFRHEHTRPQAGRCFEDDAWRELTPYDPASVMHYPQCNGTGNLQLTALDREGAALLYGAPTGSTPPPPPPSTPPPGTAPTTEFLEGAIARGEMRQYGPFSVAPGSTFLAEMNGAGDPDLYVRFDAPPTPSSYNCRPYSDTASESCRLDVPARPTSAYVMVRGYTRGTFSVNLTLTAAKDVERGPAAGTSLTQIFTGSLPRAQAAGRDFTIMPGSVFRVKMSGSGDPDLYVRFGAQPTPSTFDCRPFLDGAEEECTLIAGPNTTTASVLVNALTDATYSVEVSYTAPSSSP